MCGVRKLAHPNRYKAGPCRIGRSIACCLPPESLSREKNFLDALPASRRKKSFREAPSWRSHQGRRSACCLPHEEACCLPPEEKTFERQSLGVITNGMPYCMLPASRRRKAFREGLSRLFPQGGCTVGGVLCAAYLQMKKNFSGRTFWRLPT